ncbi:MAG TPA: trypsin-like peptidase domain-containing protein [Candidatus Bathyarchaeia archaeon]|nr:trypsin-like peptidase domain-containing protein [Candidatus Bathyarchaeia archaeon]
MKIHVQWMYQSAVLFFLCALGAVVLILVQKQRTLQESVYSMYVEQKNQEPQERTSVIETIVSSSVLWRPVQEKVKDTVVQVFSLVAAIDLLQPYKTPAQGTVTGSGFFINDSGDIITNAHVIAQAKSVWIQIPSFGKRIIDAEVVGMSPDRDIALLRLKPESVELIRARLGSIPYLALGDSDMVRRSDEVLALGYPLGQQSLKSTTGVISGTEHHFVQISAAINPGSSGGPLLNAQGHVIGINSSGIVEAQNVGYAIPINDLKIVLDDLYKVKILRKPVLGVFFNNGTEALTDYLANPKPGGCYIIEILPHSTLDRAGVQRGDMIYEINGHHVDIYGEMNVPWSEDKISVTDFVARLSTGQTLDITFYRKGVEKKVTVTFEQTVLPPIRKLYPGYEAIDYEVFGGMVVMPLSLDHIRLLGDVAPALARYAEIRHQMESKLIITHIFPNSQIYRSRVLLLGSTINEVNGISVKTLDEYREAIKKTVHKNYFTILASDNVSGVSDHIFVVLPWEKMISEEITLSQDFKYPMNAFAKQMSRALEAQKLLDQQTQPTVVAGNVVETEDSVA